MENRFNFRVWDKKNQEMFEEIYLNENCIDCKVDSGWLIRKYDDCIIMQSIGFTDKNGKLIFEGDILDNKDCSDSIVKVVFLFPSNENGNRYGFFLENLNTHSIKEFFNPDIDLNKLEIIGNIYENNNK